jgi:hypothetical protein
MYITGLTSKFYSHNRVLISFLLPLSSGDLSHLFFSHIHHTNHLASIRLSKRASQHTFVSSSSFSTWKRMKPNNTVTAWFSQS